MSHKLDRVCCQAKEKAMQWSVNEKIFRQWMQNDFTNILITLSSLYFANLTKRDFHISISGILFMVKTQFLFLWIRPCGIILLNATNSFSVNATLIVLFFALFKFLCRPKLVTKLQSFLYGLRLLICFYK